MPKAINWKAIAKREGWAKVAADPRPEYAHEGPCLWHEDQERSWPLGDWEGAARDLGIGDDGTYADYDREWGL